MANVLVQIISRADNSGFASAGRSLAKFSALAGAASSGAASAAGAVAALGTAAAGVGVLALPALGVVMAGLDGIKEAAGAAQPALDRFKSAMSGEFSKGMTGGFEKLGGVLDAIQPQMQGVARAVSGLFDGFAETVAKNTTGLQAIGDKAAEFVTRLGPGLDTLITKLIQFGASINVDSIFQVFSTLGEVLGPLANLFVQLAAAAGPFGSVLSVLGGIITAITPALVNMASQVGPQISAAFTTLSPAIVQVAEAFSQVIVAIAPALPVIASLVAALVDGLGPALPAIIGGMIAFAAVAKGLVILSAVAGFIKTMAVALRIVTVAQWLWNAALLANPLTWVVIAVVALIAVIVLIATKTTWFQTIWSAMVTAAVAVWNFIVAAVQAFVGVFMGVMTAIASFAVAAWNMILAAASAVWNAIVAVVSAVGAAIGAVISAAGAVVSAVWNAILAAASAAWNAVTAVVSAVASAIGSVIGGVVDVVVGLWETRLVRGLLRVQCGLLGRVRRWRRDIDRDRFRAVADLRDIQYQFPVSSRLDDQLVRCHVVAGDPRRCRVHGAGVERAEPARVAARRRLPVALGSGWTPHRRNRGPADRPVRERQGGRIRHRGSAACRGVRHRRDRPQQPDARRRAGDETGSVTTW